MPAGIAAVHAPDPALVAAIVAQSPLAVALYDTAGRVTLGNAAYERHFGVRVADVPATYSLFDDPQLEAAGFLPLLHRAYAGETIVLPPVRYDAAAASHGPGRTVWTQAHCSPVRDAAGRVTHLAIVHADVTAWAEAEASLRTTAHALETRHAEQERGRERAERLQALTAALAAARSVAEVGTVVVADMVVALGARTGAMTIIDPATRTLVLAYQVGFDAPVLARIARQPLDLRAPAAECARTGEPVWVESRDGPDGFDARYPDFVASWDALGVAAAAYVPLVTGGETIGTISFTFDAPRLFADADRAFLRALGQQAALAMERGRLFEAERTARAEAEAARAAAESASRARSEFLATMSHEIRTPINAIVGYTQLLELGIPDPASAGQLAQLARVTASAQHLLGLVDDVLDVAKVDAGELRVARDESGARSVMEDALALARPLADAQRVRVVGPHIDAVPDDGDAMRDDTRGDARDETRDETRDDARYVGDPARVRQILVNLLSNAAKFTPAGGTIVLSAGTVAAAPDAALVAGTGPWTYVRVADTGIGIAPAQHAAVFDPFVQAERGHTRTKGGTGLGLTISRRLARLMGGDLTLASAPGAGSTFTLWLPAAGVAADGTAESAGARGERAGLPDARWRVHGLADIGRALREQTDAILAAYVAALRADAGTPVARSLADAPLEDHATTLLADLAQSLVIVGEAGADAAALLSDCTAIQRAIAERHGVRRRRQGWTAAALRRDHALLQEAIERAVRARVSDAADLAEPLRVLAGLHGRVAALSLAAFERADDATSPADAR